MGQPNAGIMIYYATQIYFTHPVTAQQSLSHFLC